jgi:hypothetical protein
MGRIQCLACGEILVSRSRHDFVMCKCDNQAFVDGGDEYMRAGAKDLSFIKALPNGPKSKKKLARKYYK